MIWFYVCGAFVLVSICLLHKGRWRERKVFDGALSFGAFVDFCCFGFFMIGSDGRWCSTRM